MTNVMRTYQKHQFQLMNDASHRVARRLAHDIHTFFERPDVRDTRRRVAALNRHVRELSRGRYTACRAPQPKGEEQVASDEGEVVEDTEDEEDEEEGDQEAADGE
jgi:hypothetical protein